MKIPSPILRDTKAWEQVCGNINFSKILKLSDYEKNRLFFNLIPYIDKEKLKEYAIKYTDIQVCEEKENPAPVQRTRTYHKQAVIVRRFNKYFQDGKTKTKTEVYQQIAKELGKSTRSIESAIQRHNKFKDDKR